MTKGIEGSASTMLEHLHLVARVFALSQGQLQRVLHMPLAEIYATKAGASPAQIADRRRVERLRTLSDLAGQCAAMGQIRKGGELLGGPAAEVSLFDLLTADQIDEGAVVARYQHALASEPLLREQAQERASVIAEALGNAFRANRYSPPEDS